MKYYQQVIEDVVKTFEVGEDGLSHSEADKRLGRYGPNILQTAKKINPLYIFISQFKNFIIYILLFAVFFSLLIGEYVDSSIILAILLLNAVIGFFQEWSANNSLEALKKLSAVSAKVMRSGEKKIIDAKELVPGDLIFFEAGDKVPADARLIEATMLQVEESSLTGESVPSAKNPAVIAEEVQVGDQHNMLFSSTSIATGNGKAIVVGTGMQTEIGKITTLIKDVTEEMTPLQKKLDVFGKKLGMVVVFICFIVFVLAFSKDYFANGASSEALITFLFISISLAVAAVPTALPAVVTIALSVGVKRLLKKKALVRRLSSVETLGSCDVICTDKTGTLTQNQMTVRNAWTLDGEAEISGIGYNPEGEVSGAFCAKLFEAGIVANNASLNFTEGEWRIIGDPTEAALLASGAKANLSIAQHRLDELPFDSERKLMSVLVLEENRKVMYSKGAPDELLAYCTHMLSNDEEIVLSREAKEVILAKNDFYASQAMRVLAFAYKNVDHGEFFREEKMVFIGLQAMIDPPRPDVIDSIAKTKIAGIRAIMVTGDYKNTAQAIGEEIGITGGVVTGAELEKMSQEHLIEALQNNTNIFARVAPEHKQRIVDALQKMGHTVAMTGDGVNDAPALKKANIGVAVGSGTDVAKEASDFVLLDDSFTHIINAIEEGRGIYDNIQKSIMLLLSGNLGEVLIIFTAVIFGLNLPLTAILLLWINMVTDGAPALAYSIDPYGKDIMLRKPKSQHEGILPKDKIMLIGTLGVAGTVIALFLFQIYGGNSEVPEEIKLARTMVFNFVVLYECILVFAIRQGYLVPFFSNKWVWASVLVCGILQAVLMYTDLNVVFKISALSWGEIMALVYAGAAFTVIASLYSRFTLRLNQKNQAGQIRSAM